MEKILNKQEIAELLEAIHSGQLAMEMESLSEDPEIDESGVSSFDLFQGQSTGHWRVAGFDLFLDTFARYYGVTLTNLIQGAASVKRAQVSTMEFEHVVQNLTDRGVIGVARLDPLRWGGLLLFDGRLSFALVESLLGGAAGTQVLPDRPLSGIELNVVRGAIQDVCQDVVKAFQPLEELDVGLIKIETNPRLVNIVPPEAVVMLARFVVEVESREGEMALVIPLASLEPLREKLREGVALFSSIHAKGWDTFLRKELMEMEVGIRGEIGRVSLTANEILELKVGDVLDLGCLPSSPARMSVEGRPKYLARVGVKDGRNSLSLTEPVDSHR